MKVLMIMAIALAANAAQGKPIEPTQKSLKPALEKYLQERGNLCLGKFVWPIEVSAHDREIGTNDAIQMPVLEKLGLVASSDDAQSVKRYALTEAGRKFYLEKESISIGPGDKKIVHRGDFCVAKLSLNKLVGWEPPTVINEHEQTTVAYTYKIAAPDWTRTAEIAQVFPMIDRVIKGEGALQLKQQFRFTHTAWVAVLPGD